MSTNTVAITYRNAGWKDWNTVAGSGPAASSWLEPMGEAAFQGVAGDFVRLLLPETEADPAALLLTFLVGVGSMMGRGPHYRVGSTRHGVNLFTVVVGETSRARKGTATDLALDILSQVDKEFMASRLHIGDQDPIRNRRSH